jgi:hypothetical protein
MGGVAVPVQDARDPALRAQAPRRGAAARFPFFYLQPDAFAGHVGR